MSRIKNFLHKIGRSTKASKVTDAAQISSFDQYETRAPSHQNAVDALPGWNSAFPDHFGIASGAHHLYADPRIDWAIENFGDLTGKSILEVGPLEGMHTYRLSLESPSTLDAVEANKMCFFRCLVTKQILGMEKAAFHLGDVKEWLRTNETVYDLAVASGVLYHMPDPGDFLTGLAARANAIYIWTHYFDDRVMPENDARRSPFSGRVETKMVAGIPVRYYERTYWQANKNASFCGGMKDRHYWMHKDDIISVLRQLGFETIIVAHEEKSHAGGPCFSIFCKK
ncbi:DUF1698 domain-containing protein [Agrobacterium rosae]